MYKVLFYTFKSFPYIDVFNTDELFVLAKLSNDINLLEERILEDKPEVIIGVGVVRGFSRFERVAVNKFNKVKVSKNSIEYYDLSSPEKGFENIKLSYKPTRSFCNWSAFKLAEFIEQNKLDSKLSLLHINRKDKFELIKYLASFKIN